MKHMADIYGNLTLFGDARIINAKIEDGSLPTFTVDDEGRLFVYNHELYFNDGSKWSTFQLSNNSSQPLIDTLGRNWINEDLSFNPTDFNALGNITGLTSNDTLFDVFVALDAAISNVSSLNFSDLGDVDFSSMVAGDIIFFNGTTFTNITLNDLASSQLNFSSQNLSDTDIEDYASGDVLVYSEIDAKLVNRKTFAEYTNLASNTTFVVPHDLGVRHCIVQVINAQTNVLITSDYGVTFDSVDQLTVTVSPAIPVKILVTAVNLT